MAFVATAAAPGDTRSRILAGSARLFRRRGFAGTGIKAILTESNAPYGSLYHFFPGGKEELGVAAVAEGGETYRQLVEVFFEHTDDVVDATRRFFDGAAELPVHGAGDDGRAPCQRGRMVTPTSAEKGVSVGCTAPCHRRHSTPLYRSPNGITLLGGSSK